MQDERLPFRGMVTGLSAMGVVTLRGIDYSGEYLAMLVAIDPGNPEAEAARTPQVIAELGRLTAAAFREKELRDVDYRVWREKQVFLFCNDVEAAENAGFESAANPGTDAKGNAKAKKCPTTGDVETYVRTLPEYPDHYRRKLEAEETWSTLYAAYTAAQARTGALRSFERSGGVAQDRDRDRPDPAQTRTSARENQGESRYYTEGNDPLADKPVADLEAMIPVGGPRTPIPSPGGQTPPPPNTNRS